MAHKRKKTDPGDIDNEQDSPLENYRQYLSTEDFDKLRQEIDKPLLPALRINPLKGDVEKNLEIWQKRYEWETLPVPYCDTGYWVTQSTVSISQTIEHRMGRYYIQEAASMLPVELFDFQGVSAPLVLDLAASPGGKTTHLVSKTNDLGLLLANDASASRITALRLALQNWGAIGAAVTNFNGESYGTWFPETFDMILLDAPCSMQGLRSTESHPLRPISAREQTALAGRQERLIVSAFQALKPGGQLVYSTCTLSPEEDEGVVDALWRQFPGAVSITDTAKRLPRPAPALVSDGEHPYTPEVKKAARLWCHIYGTAGFFAAHIQKVTSVTSRKTFPPQRPLAKTGLALMTKRELSDLFSHFNDTWGFDLAGLLEKYKAGLWKRGEMVFIIPERWIRDYASLPFEAVGLLLGETSGLSFEVSHEFVSRFGIHFNNNRLNIDRTLADPWKQGRDIPLTESSQVEKGKMLVLFDEWGSLLGRGKVQAGRIKNLLPRRLVN